MTEQEWLACTDPLTMLASLRESGRASERKLRLFIAEGVNSSGRGAGTAGYAVSGRGASKS